VGGGQNRVWPDHDARADTPAATQSGNRRPAFGGEASERFADGSLSDLHSASNYTEVAEAP
jgi:hypothetical protein